MSANSQFQHLLKDNGYRLTKERQALFNALSTLHSPASITELAKVCSRIMDSATVYRNLAVFQKLGITHHVYSGWKYTVELSDKFSSHHHHMTCTNCGIIVSFEESQSLVSEMNKLQHKYKFKIQSHSLELSGLCSKCC